MPLPRWQSCLNYLEKIYRIDNKCKNFIFLFFFFTFKCSSEQSESHLNEVLNKEMESVSKEIKGIKYQMKLFEL